MALNKSKTRKIKRRLAYIYFPVIFAVLGIIFAGFIFRLAFPNYKNYQLMAFGDAPVFSEQLEKKSFMPFDGKQGATFDNIKDVTIPRINQQYAELKNDKLSIDAPVFWGDTDLVLRSGVGTYSGSSLPGYNSGILMSAHNSTYFKGLKDVSVGDVFRLNTTYARFEYIVRDIKVLKADHASAFHFNAKSEQLVLYTCYPFKPLSSVSNQRLFVYLEKLSGPAAANVEVDL